MGRCHCAPRRKVRLIINVSLASVKSFPPQIRESPCLSTVYPQWCFLTPPLFLRFSFCRPRFSVIFSPVEFFCVLFFFSTTVLFPPIFFATARLLCFPFTFSILFSSFFSPLQKTRKVCLRLGPIRCPSTSFLPSFPVNFPCSSLPPPPFSLFSLRGFLPDALFLARFPRV